MDRRTPDPCGNDGTLPFGAGFPVLATATLKSTSSTLAGSTTDTFPGAMGSVHREWSLAPQGCATVSTYGSWGRR